MPAGEQLRSLYIDIEANSEEAIADIEATSEVADAAAESLEDLTQSGTAAGAVLDYVGEQAESLADDLNQATASALGLNSALRSLPEDVIDDYDFGDIESPTLPETPTRESQSAEFDGPEVDQSTIAGLIALQDRIEEVDDSAIEATVGLNRYASQADEAGDESLTAAGKVQTLDFALAGLGGGQNLNSTSAGMSSILLAATALIPVILSLGAAFGGLAVAGLSLAGVLGGALAGGFLGLSERVGGAKALLTAFKDSLKEALQPLQQPIFQEFALDVLQGAVKLTGMFAEFAARTFKELKPLVDVVAGAFWDNTPEFFSALNYAATELAPILADLMTWVANAVPDGIVYLTDVAKQLAPVMADLGDSLLPLIVQLTELGVIITQTLGPAFALLVDGLTAVLKAFNSLPDSLQGGIIGSAAAILGVATALNLLSSVVMGAVGVYQSYLTVTWALGVAQEALAGSTALSTAATYAHETAMWAANSAGKAYALTTYALSSAYNVLTGAISTSTAASYARLTATKAVTAVMYAAAGARYVLSTAYGVLTGAITAATIAEYAFLAPILLVVGAIATLIGLVYAYTTNLWGFKDAVDSAAASLMKFGGALLDGALEAFGDLIYSVTHPLETLRDTLDWFRDLSLGELALSFAIPPLGMLLATAKATQVLIDKFGGLDAVIRRIEGVIKAVTQPLKAFHGILDSFRNLSLEGLALSFVIPPLGMFLATLKATQLLRDNIEWLQNVDVIDVVVNFLKQGAEDLWNWLTPDVGKAGKKIDKFAQKVKEKYRSLSEEEKAQLQAVAEAAQIAASPQWGTMPGLLAEDAKGAVKGTADWLTSTGAGLLQDAWDSLTPEVSLPDIELPSIDLSGLLPDVGSWWDKGKKAADTFVGGLTSINIGKRVGGWLKGIMPFMPGSDAQTGPLSNLTSWGQSLGETLVSGLEGTPLGRMAGQALGGLQSAFGDAKQWASGLFSGPLMPQLEMPEIPEVSMPSLGKLTPEVEMPSIPDIDVPSIRDLSPDVNMPELPTVKDLTAGIDLPSQEDIRGAMPEVPSVRDLTAGFSMPDMPSVDMPEVGNLTAGLNLPSVGDIQGAMPSLGDIGHSIESTLGVSLPDTGPLFSAGSHLRNQLASGGQDIASAVTNANVGSIDVPTVDQTLSAGSNLLGGLSPMQQSLASPVGPAPVTPGSSQQTIDKSDRSLNPSVKQDLTVEVNESDNPQAIRKEVERVSGDEAVESIVGVLQRDTSQ